MTVYCPQIPTYWDKDKQKHFNVYQLPPAEEFGDIIKVLPYGVNVTELDFIMSSLTTAFKNYNHNKDYLMFLGHPTIVALSFAAVSYFTKGKISFLQWDNENKNFIPTHIDFNKGN